MTSEVCVKTSVKVKLNRLPGSFQNNIAETLTLTIKSDIHSQVSDGNVSYSLKA